MTLRIAITSVFLIAMAGLPARGLSPKSDSTTFVPTRLAIRAHHGYLVPHHRSMAFSNTEYINGAELFVSGYFPGVATRRPTNFGIGYYCSNLGSREVYGNAHAIFAAIEADFFRTNLPFYFQQATAFGISYNTERFDIQDNSYNRAIGSHLNAYASISFSLVVEINDRLTLSAGPSLVHTSNGNIRHPNFGLNLLNTRAGLAYRFRPLPALPEGSLHEGTFPEGIRSEGTPPQIPSPFRKHSAQIIASGGVRQLSHKIRENFFVGSLLADYSYRVNRYQALGGGADLFWDPTEGRETYVTESRVEDIVPWHLGMHLTWERYWNRFSIVLQPGYKVLTLSEHNFMQYNRAGIRYRPAGIRYRPAEHLILSCAIKAHGFRADFIEFGVGVALGR
jgi:hypothetical protein